MPEDLDSKQRPGPWLVGTLRAIAFMAGFAAAMSVVDGGLRRPAFWILAAIAVLAIVLMGHTPEGRAHREARRSQQ